MLDAIRSGSRDEPSREVFEARTLCMRRKRTAKSPLAAGPPCRSGRSGAASGSEGSAPQRKPAQPEPDLGEGDVVDDAAAGAEAELREERDAVADLLG